MVLDDNGVQSVVSNDGRPLLSEEVKVEEEDPVFPIQISSLFFQLLKKRSRTELGLMTEI